MQSNENPVDGGDGVGDGPTDPIGGINPRIPYGIDSLGNILFLEIERCAFCGAEVPKGSLGNLSSKDLFWPRLGEIVGSNSGFHMCNWNITVFPCHGSPSGTRCVSLYDEY